MKRYSKGGGENTKTGGSIHLERPQQQQPGPVKSRREDDTIEYNL
jgi:hypothetical protein